MNSALRAACVAAFFVASGSAWAMPVAADATARHKALHALLDEQWQHTLHESPELATTMGDLRYNTRWADQSPAHAAAEYRTNADFLRRFEAIDTGNLSEDDQLNQRLMVRQLKETMRAYELKLHEMPLDQFNGVHLQLPGFVSSIPFDTTRQYEDYLARLKAIPAVLDQVIAMSRQGMHDGMMQPRYLLEAVARQADSIADPAGEASAFAVPLAAFPKDVGKADRKRLHDAIVATIDQQVRPAYRKLAKFVRDDYAPHGRTEPGLWQLANGDELYRFDAERMTTTHETPERIHHIGLAEVARIEAEMTAIAQAKGYSDLASFRAALAKDPSLHPSSRDDLLARYRAYVAQMQPELPKLFGVLPKTQVRVMPVEAYREKEAPGAEYHQGTPDGSRPGMVFINTWDYANRTILTIESTAYHEGIPGHHMQISIAQTLPNLPTFRQQAGYNAYVEGWALYAERLGKDIGFYRDPLSDYGRLSDELLRANRLVLDTGVHYKHWTRQQMVDWFHAHSSDDEPDIQAETDRYIAWPGQALGYKMGQLKILELRDRARQALGQRFDIRAFHDQVLGGGALPLDVLEQRMDAWIARVKAGQPS